MEINNNKERAAYRLPIQGGSIPLEQGKNKAGLEPAPIHAGLEPAAVLLQDGLTGFQADAGAFHGGIMPGLIGYHHFHLIPLYGQADLDGIGGVRIFFKLEVRLSNTRDKRLGSASTWA